MRNDIHRAIIIRHDNNSNNCLNQCKLIEIMISTFIILVIIAIESHSEQ